jgi:cytidylate kinase
MIITLSRQTGAGARTIGPLLGQRLGLPVLDLNIRQLVAERLQCSEEAVIALDERLEPAGDRALRFLGVAVAPETGVALGLEPAVTAGDVESATRDLILDIASRESLIIMGRAARWILGLRPDALHVRLVAPLEARVERYAERERTDRKTARNVVQSTDRARAAHVQRYYQVDWDDPQNYHLILNTGLLSIAAAVDLILAAARECCGG